MCSDFGGFDDEYGVPDVEDDFETRERNELALDDEENRVSSGFCPRCGAALAEWWDDCATPGCGDTDA